MSRKRPIIILLSAVICAAIAGAFAFGEERPSADKINDSALIIGTYLIDFQALNEENQALAEADAQKSNQHKVYYKSELNNGVWYDITDAESVSDISLTNSRIVDDSVIDGITLTRYYKADGSVVDFETGKTIPKQDEETFSPSNMQELSAVTKQRDIVSGLADDESKENHEAYSKEVSVLDEIFQPISDDTCSGLVRSLNALDKVIDSAQGSAKESAVSVKVKKRAELDKYCREIVCGRINDAIEELIDHDNAAHAELISMLSDAQTELNGSITDSAADIGSQAASAAEKKQQQLQEELVSAAEAGNIKGASETAQTLSVLEAMINGEPTDSKAAGELSQEMLSDAMDGIESTVSSILSGTHEYYDDGGSGMTAQEVLAQVQTDIAEARQLAKDKAFYNTGSTSSDKYNESLAEDLSALGLVLSALSENGGSDELSGMVISAVEKSAEDILSDAAEAKALSVPETAAQKLIDDLSARIDNAYRDYLDALNSSGAAGSGGAGGTGGTGGAANAAADEAMKRIGALQEQLDALRSDIEKEVAALTKELFGEMNSGSPDKDKIREINAQLSVEAGYLPETDKALLEQAMAALEDMEEAADIVSVSKTETAYDQLSQALQNVPSSLLDDSVKADMLKYAAKLLDKLSSSGEDISGLKDDITRDINAAYKGEFTPAPGGSGGSGGSGSSGGSGGSGGSSTDGTIDDKLFEYKLVIPSLNIFSNTMSIEKSGTVFVDINALSREAGLSRFQSGDVRIYRGNDVLIELTPGSTEVYIGDKLFAPSSPPYSSGKALYVPIDLVEAGLRLTAETENGTTFMR